jgi:hypothetical protein
VIDSFLTNTRSGLLCALSAILLIASAGLVHLSRSLPGTETDGEELMYFPSGRFLKEASLGHQMAVADMAWLRAIQYYGTHRQTDQVYDMAGHIFEVVTTLDPLFRNAYVFGGLVLAQDAGDVEGGVALLRKGIANLPDEWLLPFEVGFIYYICSADMDRAQRWFLEAAAKPEHPESVERFAAFCAARSGDLKTALRLWVQLYESTDNEYVRQMAEKRVRDLLEDIAAAQGRDIGQMTQPVSPGPQ